MPDPAASEPAGIRLEPDVGFGRRLAALGLDWAACLLVVRLLAPDLRYGSPPYSALTLAVFATEVVLLTWLGGASFGQRLVGLLVLRPDGGPIGLPRAVMRTLLVLLVVPPLVRGADGRPWHDVVAGTVLLRRRRELDNPPSS